MKSKEILIGRVLKKRDIGEALRECAAANLTPAYAPFITHLRARAEREDFIWGDHFTSPSVLIFGSSQGRKIEVYAHGPNFYSTPEHIVQGLATQIHCGAMIYPQQLFDAQSETPVDSNMFVIDSELANKWPRGSYGIEKPTDEHCRKYGGEIEGIPMIAKNNPRLGPSLGVDEITLDTYLTTYEKSCGREIGVWHDFSEEYFQTTPTQPRARFLLLTHDTTGVSTTYPYVNGALIGLNPAFVPSPSPKKTAAYRDPVTSMRRSQPLLERIYTHAYIDQRGRVMLRE